MQIPRYIIPIFVPHEGCPHDCVFCNQNSITGSSVKVTAEYVDNTVKDYLKTIPVKNRILEISFFGGTFTAISKEKQIELLKAANYYKTNGIIDYIRLSTRPDYINNEILAYLKEYSVDIIELGVQSMDDEVLRLSGRGHTAQQVREASKLIKEFGFTLGLQVMLGLPGDDFTKDIKTADEIIRLEPEISRIYPALVIKDTPMEKMYERNLYKPYTLEEAVKISKVIYAMFTASGIKVIRIGLQPTEDINVGRELIAGPFHPAFRELVEGSIYNDIIVEYAPKSELGDIRVTLNPKDISKLYANKKYFFNDTKKQLKTLNLIINQSDFVQREEILLEHNNNCRRVSIYEYLTDKYKEGYLELL